jgi:resuscitation-promoting factor RpfA
MTRTAALLLRAAGLVVVVVLVAAAAGGGGWSLAHRPWERTLGLLRAGGPRGWASAPFDDALTALCGAALLCCVVWLTLTTALVMAAYVAQQLAPHGRATHELTRVSERGCPAPLRRLVAAALGAAVGAAIASVPAHAVTAETHHRPSDRLATRDVDGLTGLAEPDRTTGGGREAVPRLATARVSDGPGRRPRARVVRPGESLWSISAALLPSTATDADVTLGWHSLAQANADRLGSDPDLILPGTRLLVPDPAPAAHRDVAPRGSAPVARPRPNRSPAR